MSEPEKKENVARIRVMVDIPGIAEAGDCIIYDPDHPNPHLRLCRIQPLDVDLLPQIREKVGAYQDVLSDLVKSPGGEMLREMLGDKEATQAATKNETHLALMD